MKKIILSVVMSFALISFAPVMAQDKKKTKETCCTEKAECKKADKKEACCTEKKVECKDAKKSSCCAETNKNKKAKAAK